MVAVFVMQANVAEGYAVGGMAFLLGCYVMWRLEWRLPYALRVGVTAESREA
jgi:hypothetical protein